MDRKREGWRDSWSKNVTMYVKAAMLPAALGGVSATCRMDIGNLNIGYRHLAPFPARQLSHSWFRHLSHSRARHLSHFQTWNLSHFWAVYLSQTHVRHLSHFRAKQILHCHARHLSHFHNLQLDKSRSVWLENCLSAIPYIYITKHLSHFRAQHLLRSLVRQLWHFRSRHPLGFLG